MVESKAATSILLDIYSNSLLFLSIRCMCGVNQIGSILQAMAILQHLEQQKLLKLVDDSIWRGLFVACSSIKKGNFAHKATCVLFTAYRACTNSSTDAIIATLYCKSFSQLFNSKKKSQDGLDEPALLLTLDPFHHLEQLGVAWILQKLSLSSQNEQNQILPSSSNESPTLNSHSPDHQTTKPSPNTENRFWGMFLGKKKIPGNSSEESNLSTQQSNLIKQQPYATTPSDLSKILQLSRGNELFALRKPRNLLTASVAIRSELNNLPAFEKINFTDRSVDARVLEIQELHEQIHFQDKPSNKNKAIAALLETEPTNFGKSFIFLF
jgi:hypothetical protein